MAVRGLATVIDFYPLTSPIQGDTAIYSYQNHFPGDWDLFGPSYTPASYNPFTVDSTISERDVSSMPDLNITFVATAANVDLVQEALANQYLVSVITYRWTSTEGIDNPTSVNPFALHIAVAAGGSQDVSTVSLKLAHYNNTVSADMPWRKIPWTIVGPLSPRR